MSIMDGDLYLIKLVKSRPIIWTPNLDPNKWELESAWNEISAKIGTDSDWIKSRWYNLQERFTRALKMENSQNRSKFKFFKHMLFLVSSVRSGLTTTDDKPEFIITKQELEEGSDDADDVIVFEEIIIEKPTPTDEVANTVIAEIFGEECDSTEPDKDECQKQKHASLSTSNVDDRSSHEPPSKVRKISSSGSEKAVEERLTDAEDNVRGNDAERSKPVENCLPKQIDRCEDVIFGELVTAMLKTISDSKKKQVKKEIMNILLS